MRTNILIVMFSAPPRALGRLRAKAKDTELTLVLSSTVKSKLAWISSSKLSTKRTALKDKSDNSTSFSKLSVRICGS